jgi:hypothetical protein
MCKDLYISKNMSTTQKELKELAVNLIEDRESFINSDGTPWVDSDTEDCQSSMHYFPKRGAFPSSMESHRVKKIDGKDLGEVRFSNRSFQGSDNAVLEMYSEVSKYANMLSVSEKKCMTLQIELDREEHRSRISILDLSTSESNLRDLRESYKNDIKSMKALLHNRNTTIRMYVFLSILYFAAMMYI